MSVIAIVPYPPGKLAESRTKYGLGFVLLSDPEYETAEAYGAWGEQSMDGKKNMGITRSHAAIDENGKIVAIKNRIRRLETAGLRRVWKQS